MTATKRCDNCGAVEESAFTWFHVDRDLRSVADPDGGWDFDSADCLRAWAENFGKPPTGDAPIGPLVLSVDDDAPLVVTAADLTSARAETVRALALLRSVAPLSGPFEIIHEVEAGLERIWRALGGEDD